MDFLRDPIWQGVGAIISVLAFMLAVVVDWPKIRQLFPRRSAVSERKAESLKSIRGYRPSLFAAFSLGASLCGMLLVGVGLAWQLLEPSPVIPSQVTPIITMSPMPSTSTNTPTFTPSPIDTLTATGTSTWTVQPTTTVFQQPTSTPVLLTPTPLPGSILTRTKDLMIMAYVPSGTFQMGSYYGEPDAAGHEYPQHTVALDDFWIDQTEVTNRQYGLCVMDQKCTKPTAERWSNELYYGNSKYDDYPVVYVTWDQARVYCEWAGAVLPTEAQWEYAARGTSSNTYPWGNNPPSNELAAYKRAGPAKVGSYPKGKSWCGALDMAGNVWEWVSDWYDGDYYSKSPTRDPIGSTNEKVTKVMRGGSWAYDKGQLRAANRGNNYPFSSFRDTGFRCVVFP